LLVPDGAPTFDEEMGNWLKWDERTQSLTIINHGVSPAFNVASVLYGCESYIIQGNRDPNSRDEHWTCWLGKPVPVNGEVAATFDKGNSIFFDANKSIGGHAFNAPPEPRSVKSESWLSRGFGEPRTACRCAPSLPNRTVQDALTQEIKVGATIHLTLEELEARDMPFGLP
jgi:hypothetical protein